MASAGPDKNLTVIPIDVLTAPEPTQVAETIADTLPEALPKPVAEPVPEPVPKAMVEPVAEPNVESDKKNYEDPDAENKSENDLKWELTSEEEQELESSEGTDSDSVVDFEAVEKAEKAESDEKNARKAVLKAQRKGYFTSQELDAVEKELERESLTDKEEIIISPLPTYTDLIEKNRTPSEYSYTMDDNDIEKVLQKDRVDEFDNIDTPLQTKPTGINTLTLKENFLELFEIPSLSDISEEQEIKPISPKLKRRATQFINSMKKGSSLATVESSDSFSIEGSDGLEHMALSAFASLINIPEHQKSKSVEIDLFALSKPELKFCDTDMSEKRTSNLLSMTMELLKDLLDKVVQNAEINKINRSLRSKLDNESLWWKLKKEVDAFMYQRELNNFLNARMVDYYKRMKSQRQFQRLPNSLIVTEYNRRNDALKLYDHVVNVAKETKKKVSYLMASVLMDLTYVENIERDTEEHLENVIVETINRKNSEHLQKVAEREIRLMNKKRDEMSDVRLALITRKHTLARITGVSLKIVFFKSFDLLYYCLFKMFAENRNNRKDQ